MEERRGDVIYLDLKAAVRARKRERKKMMRKYPGRTMQWINGVLYTFEWYGRSPIKIARIISDNYQVASSPKVSTRRNLW